MSDDEDSVRLQESLKAAAAANSSHLAGPQPCPTGWQYKSLTSSCYIVPSTFLSWSDAENYCENVTGGSLLSILSQPEYDLIQSLVQSYSPLYPVWLGLFRDPSLQFSNVYRWIDNNYRLNLTKWLPNEPSNPRDCFIWKTTEPSGYKSISCKYSQPFLCKQHAANCETTVFEGMSGNLSSPNYPFNYDNNLDCYYHITVPDGYIVKLTVLDFATEGEYNYFDYVQIFDGPDDQAFSLHKLGGTKVPIGFVYESTQRYMTIKFHTDFSGVNTGWLLNFIASTPNATAYFNATAGTISSPNYPNPYPNSFLQFYKIVVPETKIVLVEVIDFVTEPNFDYLRIMDGNNATDISQTLGLLSGNLTGNGSMPMTFYSTQSIVSLLFYTDHSFNRTGWTLNFRTAPKLN
uniref:Uncharacterized protein n=1 Tax=Panagrolaimus sp. ES5 TaxID=591445 RepID=A0AC34G344_9BILA